MGEMPEIQSVVNVRLTVSPSRSVTRPSFRYTYQASALAREPSLGDGVACISSYLVYEYFPVDELSLLWAEGPNLEMLPSRVCSGVPAATQVH